MLDDQLSSQKSQGAALQRLLDVKGPVRSQIKQEKPFLDALDEVLMMMDQVDEDAAGWLNGSISGECWQDYMEQLRLDLLTRLQQYRDGARLDAFTPASLNALKSERQKIERLYIRDLVGLYQHAAQRLKTLSG